MATARKKWLRVYDEVADHPWSNDVLATFVRLQCHMNTKWARNGLSREAACKPCLTAPIAFQITGRRRLDAALAVLREAGDAAGFSCEHRGDVIAIDWPKYAELQDLAPDRGAGAASDLPPPQTQTPTQTLPQTHLIKERFLKGEEIGGSEATGYRDRPSPSRFQGSARRSRSSAASAQRAQAAADERERERVEMMVVLTPVKEVNAEFRAARQARGVSDLEGRAALEAVARSEAGDQAEWALNSGDLASRVTRQLRDFSRREWGTPS